MFKKLEFSYSIDVNFVRILFLLLIFQFYNFYKINLSIKASNLNIDTFGKDNQKKLKDMNFKSLIDDDSNFDLLAGVGVKISDSTRYILRLKDLRAKDPLNPELSYQMGNFYFSKKMFDDAIKEYRRCLKVQPEHENAKFFLSLSLIQKGYLEEAFIHARDLIDIDPYQPQYYKLAGEILEKMNLPEYAKDYFNRWFYLLNTNK